MAQPGWYPDPSGRPAHFRYWDGGAWSAETTTDPSSPPPTTSPHGTSRTAAAGGTPSGRSNRRSLGALLAVGAALVVLVLVVVLVVRNLTGDDPGITSTPPSPTSTVSAWDETSKPSATPTPTPAESPKPPPEEVTCPAGDPANQPPQPDRERVTGNKLSFAKIRDYDRVGPKYGLSWLNDTIAQSQSTEPGWESFFAIGDIEVQDYFDTPGNAATASMQCMINDNFFAHFTDRKDLRNEAVEISGRPGWVVSSEIRVDDPSISVEGDVVTVIFIDDGRKDRLSGFIGVYPIGDKARETINDDVIASLRVEG